MKLLLTNVILDFIKALSFSFSKLDMSKSPIIERKESSVIIPSGKILLEIEIEAYQELKCPKNTRSMFNEDLTIKQLIRQVKLLLVVTRSLSPKEV